MPDSHKVFELLDRAREAARRVMAAERALESERRELQGALAALNQLRQAEESVEANSVEPQVSSTVAGFQTFFLPKLLRHQTPGKTNLNSWFLRSDPSAATAELDLQVECSRSSWPRAVEETRPSLTAPLKSHDDGWALSTRAARRNAQKYELLADLIANDLFDIGFAARALYQDDSERSRNRVHAGLAHLRAQGRIARSADGKWRIVPRGKKERENAL